jgi:hypothetical protein
VHLSIDGHIWFQFVDIHFSIMLYVFCIRLSGPGPNLPGTKLAGTKLAGPKWAAPKRAAPNSLDLIYLKGKGTPDLTREKGRATGHKGKREGANG